MIGGDGAPDSGQRASASFLITPTAPNFTKARVNRGALENERFSGQAMMLTMVVAIASGMILALAIWFAFTFRGNSASDCSALRIDGVKIQEGDRSVVLDTRIGNHGKSLVRVTEASLQLLARRNLRRERASAAPLENNISVRWPPPNSVFTYELPSATSCSVPLQIIPREESEDYEFDGLLTFRFGDKCVTDPHSVRFSTGSILP